MENKEENVVPETTENEKSFKYDNLESANEKIKEMESLIVKHKKEKKESPEPTGTISEIDIEKKVEEIEFFKSNPDLSEFKDTIKDYTSNKGLTLQEASTLAKSDPTYLNRKKANDMSISGGESSSNKKTYKTSDLAKMNQADYNKVMALRDQKKITILD
jgi:phosphotransacetylase